MKKRKTLLALAASAFAAAVFALPASAFAADATLTQSDFSSAVGGIYVITEPGTYTLDGDAASAITGTIQVNVSGEKEGLVTIDLNGKTLQNAASVEVVETKTDLIDIRNSDVTVKNGTLVSYNNSVVRTNESSSISVTLEGVTATSYNHHCIDIAAGSAVIKSGSYTADIAEGASEGDHYVAYAEGGNIEVQGGSFSGGRGDIVKASSYEVTLAGGSFERIPSQGVLSEGSAAACVKGQGDAAAYEIKSLADARDGNGYAVLDAGKLGVVFYATKDEADAAVAALGGSAKTYEAKDYTVTFYKDASSVYQTATVHFYDKVAKPAVPPSASDGQAFKSWQLDSGSYDFDTPVVEDLKLYATYGTPIAEVTANGIAVKYADAQEAIESAVEGSYIKLLVDYDSTLGEDNKNGIGFKDKNNIVFDLNKKTVMGAIVAMDCDGLQIKNGTITAPDFCAVYLCDCANTKLSNMSAQWAEGDESKNGRVLISVESSDVEITGGSFAGGKCRALVAYGDDESQTASDHSITINSGTFSSAATGYNAVVDIYNCTTVTVNGGEFTATGDMNQAFSADGCVNVTIKNGTFNAKGGNAVYLAGDAKTVATISGGEFTGVEKYGDGSGSNTTVNECVCADEDITLNVSGGTFNDYIGVDEDEEGISASVHITGGSFGSPESAAYVQNGYAMLKQKGGKYQVLTDSAAYSRANWLVTATTTSGEPVTGRFYFTDEDEAKAFCDKANNQGDVTATVTAIDHSDDNPYSAADVAAAKKVSDQLAEVQADYASVTSDNAQAAGDAAQSALDAYAALTKTQKGLVSESRVSAVQSILDQGRARMAADMISAVLAKYSPVTAANAQEAADAADAAIAAYGDLSAAQRKLADQYAGEGSFDAAVDVRDAAQSQVGANTADQEALAAVEAKVVKSVKLTKKEKRAGKKTSKAKTARVKAAKSASGAKAAWSKVSASKGLKVKGGKVTLKKGAKKGRYVAKLRVAYGAYSKVVRVVFRVR